MLSDCQCFHPLYLDKDDVRAGREPCDLVESATQYCVQEVINQFNRDLRRCNCNASCEEFSYRALPSVSLWPSKQYEVSSAVVKPKTPLLLEEGRKSVRL